MKEFKPAAINYKTSVLRIAYKKITKPEAIKQLQEIPPETKKTNYPEFYQHHIKPKRFEFL